MSRQQRRAQERAQEKAEKRISAFRAANPLAEYTYQEAYRKGRLEGINYAMKTCYAAAVLAARDMEGYGHKRSTRFLRRMDEHVTLSLSSEEIMDEAFERAGVRICFREPFPEDRIEEVTP